MSSIVEELEIKKQFGKFLKGYVLRHHTVDLPTMDEVDKLTDDFLNSIDTNFYFDEYYFSINVYNSKCCSVLD